MLGGYAAYLEERIRAYRELRHDVIRASDAARTRGGDPHEGAESGLRLRKLTVEKGLLREIHICQKVLGRLLDLFFSVCTFTPPRQILTNALGSTFPTIRTMSSP